MDGILTEYCLDIEHASKDRSNQYTAQRQGKLVPGT